MNLDQFESMKRAINAETNGGVLLLYYIQLEGLIKFGPTPLQSRLQDLQTATGKRINAIEMIKEITKTTTTVDPIKEPNVLEMKLNQPVTLNDNIELTETAQETKPETKTTYQKLKEKQEEFPEGSLVDKDPEK